MEIAKYRDMFLTESTEHLQKMIELLVAVEADPDDREGIDALFREAHSIKGMAATMGYEATARLAHHFEDGLDLCREQGLISSELIDHLLAGVDLLDGLLEDIRNQQPEREVESFIAAAGTGPLLEVSPEELVSSVPEEAHEEAPERPGGIQVKLHLDDSVAAPGAHWLVLLKRVAMLGELLRSQPSEEEILSGRVSRQLLIRLNTALSKDEIRERLKSYRELSAIDFPVALPPCKAIKKTTAGNSVRVRTDQLDHFINLAGELITNRYVLQSAAGEKSWSDLNEGLSQLARLVKKLHHQVLQVRMMPLDSITKRLPRAVRDLCRSSGKKISFEVEGAAIELDRAILEELTDPLIHMLRNAIDHGIESQGKVQIRAWREQDQVLIQVADNGRGIDPEKIKRRALERSLLSPAQAETIRDYDLLPLICRPGFSTATELTATSGRGVGMDVVKAAVEKLGGVLLIDSTPGEGTRITMKLPLSVAIIRVLMIECDQTIMAVPIPRVLQALEISPEEVQTSGKQLVIPHHGELLPLLSLRRILNRPKGPTCNPLSLVITELLGRKVGLVVDRLIGQREVFVQSLPAPFDRLRGTNGGTILGDGRIMFVLDLQSLLEKRQGERCL